MHTHGRATSAKRTPEERESARRPDSRAQRPTAAAPMSAQNVLALQRAIGNQAVSRLVDTERHTHGPSCGHAAATPVQRVKTEEERGAHHRRIEMAETAARQLAGGVNGTLADHLFLGTPMTGAVDRNAPQGLHAYDGGRLPGTIELVETAEGGGNTDKVHVITWKYRGAAATKRSTMFPKWMPRNHVLALVALERGGNVQTLPVNASNNIHTGETRPVSAAEIKKHILRDLTINLQVVGDTVYPSHTAF